MFHAVRDLNGVAACTCINTGCFRSLKKSGAMARAPDLNPWVLRPNTIANLTATFPWTLSLLEILSTSSSSLWRAARSLLPRPKSPAPVRSRSKRHNPHQRVASRQIQTRRNGSRKYTSRLRMDSSLLSLHSYCTSDHPH
jgi:hypothetical protein